MTSPTDRTPSADRASDTARTLGADRASDTARTLGADRASDTARTLGGDAGSDTATAHPPGEGRGARLARFEQLLARGERLRARALPFDDLRELARLYRAHAAQLARLRSRSTDPDAIRHLNALCVRAYGFLYSSSRSSANSRPGHPESSWQARLLATAGARRAAWALLILGAVLGGALSDRDPAALYALLPAGFGYQPEVIDELWSSAAARAEFLTREPGALAHNAFFGTVLFTHNTRVGLLAFASGALGGVPTVLLQLYNGLMLGSFSALFLRDPLPVDFAAWLLPHAVPELTAITLCAAGGLVLGAAVLAPGRRSRAASLRAAAPAALTHFFVSVPLWLWAAAVESFVRESALGAGPRLALAALEAVVLLAAASGLARHARRREHASVRWLSELA